MQRCGHHFVSHKPSPRSRVGGVGRGPASVMPMCVIMRKIWLSQNEERKAIWTPSPRLTSATTQRVHVWLCHFMHANELRWREASTSTPAVASDMKAHTHMSSMRRMHGDMLV